MTPDLDPVGPDDDDLDIDLRSPAEVGRRMVALAAVAYRAGVVALDEPGPGEDDPDEVDAAEDDVEDRLDWLAWLADHDILGALTPSELDLLRAPDDLVAPDALDAASTAAESLGALAWATHRSSLTVLDRGYPYADLLEAVPGPWDDPAPFLTGLHLRPEPEIALAREAAEVLAWRALAEVERRTARGPALREVEAAIRDVAAEAASAGVVPLAPDRDVAVAGASVRSLPDTALQSMVAAAHGRLRALNWLCGLGAWDDPSLTDI